MTFHVNIWHGGLIRPYGVGRRSRRTFSTDFEIFRRRVDDVVFYFFFNSDFKFVDDASEFSVTSYQSSATYSFTP